MMKVLLKKLNPRIAFGTCLIILYQLLSFNSVLATSNKPLNRINVSGNVTSSADGLGLPGANILVKGTFTGTVTDINGQYTLNVPNETDTLVFSSIGYITQEVAVSGRAAIDVVLEEDVESLDEVVVVGYGTQSARQVSSAVSKVDIDELSDLPVAQFSQKLQGKLAGVQVSQTTGTPGGGMDIRIRGAASITAGTSPLYVVDGNPITGGISNINPNEIESISVLKDAAATALYGSRAANGVVLIETKKARAGETIIDYNGYAGLQQIPNRGRPVMMTAREFAEWRKEMAEFRGQPVDAEYQDPSQYGEGTDWYEALTRVASIQDHRRSEEHTSELQSRPDLVCRPLLEKKKTQSE